MVTAWRGLVEYGVPKTMAANVVGLQLGDLPDGDVQYMPLNLVPISEAEETREAQTEAQQPKPTEAEPVEETPEEGAPENATEDERDEGKSVKKNYPGPTIKSRRSGKRMTGLVGAGNASSRLALNKRLKSTNGKYSPD